MERNDGQDPGCGVCPGTNDQDGFLGKANIGFLACGEVALE